MKKTVPYITGDGVGVEITPSMQAIVNAAVKKAYGNEHEIEWMEVLAGERAFNETGSWLPDETMEAFKKYGVVSVYAQQRCIPPGSGMLCCRHVHHKTTITRAILRNAKSRNNARRGH